MLAVRAPTTASTFDGNGTTTFAAGTTVRGHSGLIGGQINVGGTQTLVNNGTINAELAGGTISFSDSALVNNNLVRAQAGTMNVGVALSGTGTLQVDSTGAMNLAAGAKTQGQLVMGAAGAALNLNTGNLTITGDYTNVGAGSGNAFNRRAGVTGTGQIVAGANAAQVITGAGVSNGGDHQRHADDRQRARRRHHLQLPGRQQRQHRPDAARRDPDQRQRRQPHRYAPQWQRRHRQQLQRRRTRAPTAATWR